MVAVALLSALLLAGPAAAFRGCGGHHMDTSCDNVNHVKRQVTNDDAVKNCVYYSDPARDAIKDQFPVLWQDADILPNDATAKALFDPIDAEVKQKFPNIQPKGTRYGSADVQYDQAADPDCWWTRSRCTTPKPDTGLGADITSLPEPETWGLGIDDGPNCTNVVLYDFLKTQNPPIKASLYYIGSNVINWPQQARRAVDDGHQICVHTWSHPSMTSRTNSQAFAELYYTRLIIQKILGRTPTCWRPPLGDVDNRIRFIASKLNLTLHLWSDDTFDWTVGSNGVTMDNITANYQKVYAKAQSGEFKTHGPIVLNHEVNNQTMSEIINQIPNIKANFKYIVPVATGLNITNPYEEQDITFPNFATLTGNMASGNVSASPSGSKSAGGSTTSAADGKKSSATTTVASSSVFVVAIAALTLLI